MSTKIAIIGAGSIGNHLAFSCRKYGWQVEVFDIDGAALSRFENEIYPSRYGSFDKEIKLSKYENFLGSALGSFDAILIGTPPETHFHITLDAVNLKPKLILIEKPITGPSVEQIVALRDLFSINPDITFLCGYNHKVNLATAATETLLEGLKTEGSLTLEVFWQESWDGILKAHPWLKDQNESYLGYYARGGGALFEHSHGLDIWLYFAKLLGMGKVSNVDAYGIIRKDATGKPQYDERIEIELRTEKGFIGKVIQDVVTFPARKNVVINSAKHKLTLGFGDKDLGDFITLVDSSTNSETLRMSISKSRAFDFDLEINEIARVLSLKDIGKSADSKLSGLLALETAEIATICINSALEFSRQQH